MTLNAWMTESVLSNAGRFYGLASDVSMQPHVSARNGEVPYVWVYWSEWPNSFRGAPI